MQLFIKCGSRYKPASRSIIAEVAGYYLDTDIIGANVTQPSIAREFLESRLENQERENFGAMFLDSRHKVIDFKIMFQGTIDQASVYPREVVKYALDVNAAAIIFAHNHPSGDSEPSNADRQITIVLKDALALVDVRVLDHYVIGKSESISFAERGYI